jgi:hypothetical protein
MDTVDEKRGTNYARSRTPDAGTKIRSQFERSQVSKQLFADSSLHLSTLEGMRRSYHCR